VKLPIAVADEIAAQAEPERIRTVLTDIAGSDGELSEEVWERLGSDASTALVRVIAVSQSLSRAVVARPQLLDALIDDPERERSADEYATRALQAIDGSLVIPGVATPELGTDGAFGTLRRWKQYEFFRIAGRDLLYTAGVASATREIAGLAEGALRASLALAAPEIPMAIIGMGKLGGRELNYSSDVDVLFVHDGDHREAERAAREVLRAMAKPLIDGIIFRTDADLRPEGGAGPLSLSLAGFIQYWDHRARPWEFQALMKARHVAGDETLGAAFMDASRTRIWSGPVAPEAVAEIRTLKARSEANVEKKRLTGRELKRGTGGIRDIEFAVQLLQMVHGHGDPEVRQTNTIEALDALAGAGFLARSQADQLATSYRYLRRLEHRIQLWQERQTHTLPDDAASVERIARSLGYHGDVGHTATEAFLDDLRAHQREVRDLHERIFFRPIIDALAGADPLPDGAAEDRLAAFGFGDANKLRAAMQELTGGMSRSSSLLGQILPLLLTYISASPDPELGLLQLRTVAEGTIRARNLAKVFRESLDAAERLCLLLGSSRVVGQGVIRHPDLVAWLEDDDALARSELRTERIKQAQTTLAWRGSDDRFREGLARFVRQSRLEVAARDLLDLADTQAVGHELTAIADACVNAALTAAEPQIPFAVIGLGRYGSEETSYQSDLDLLFVFDGAGDAAQEANRIAKTVRAHLGTVTPEGRPFEVDLDLRPEGAKGPICLSLAGFERYWQQRAQWWEFQSLVRARPIAGDPVLGQRFMDQAADHVYQRSLPNAAASEIRRMKARVESERVAPGSDQSLNLKLGAGALSDVEFAVQLLQLRHGGVHPLLRVSSTLEALQRLAAVGLISQADDDVLRESFVFCTTARNHLYLYTGQAGNSLPTSEDVATPLAKMMGYTSNPVTTLLEEHRRITRRARASFERLFYGQRVS
jgi:glutamate-ammonia-ligase adenylyltransferase